jgi:hypothetical protein
MRRRFEASETITGCEDRETPIAMNISPEDFSGTTGFPRHARDRVQQALRAGRERAQENPLPIVLGALVIGVLVGWLCHRESKPKDVRQLTREFFEDAATRLAHRLHWERGSQARDHVNGFGRKGHGGRFW